MTTDTRVAHWLASALDTPSTAWLEWERGGAALLPTGKAFDAVRISAAIIHAAAQSGSPDAVGPYLDRIVDGPVIHDAYGAGLSYYALVPPGTIHRTTRPGVYWLLPPRGVGHLCAPAGLGQLIHLGRRVGDPPSDPGGPDLDVIAQRCRNITESAADLAHDLRMATEATHRAHGYLVEVRQALNDAAGQMPPDAPARSRVLLSITEACRQLGLTQKEDVPSQQFAHAQRLAECCIAQVALLRGLVEAPAVPP
ncbi:DUF6415 family natural product biosynthesis protein [Streptomyces sp. TLI_146]|uniref:DUF6415 family natural product biosynthesis protein n=1 Tax=Streptomyces sp. TLI_146 TaxID=1938858 RepID=UPI000C700CD9|nr:DUF6415 family natural product biosynthesis protein [Streptomyces sp. TLI_146]PKV88681.1 hypothetical protein BX283_6304 [Streptomyces sp. TLI_146]